LNDTEKFFIPMLQNNETLLNPSPFIQSTHNTISAQISLFLKCHSYNVTYSHRNLSFESALFDSMLMLKEKSADNILLGGIDEITENYFTITNRLGLWKKEKINNLSLAESNTTGSIAGEGSVFFLLSDKKNEKSFAKIISVETINKTFDNDSLKHSAISFLKENGLELNDISAVMLGLNGDKDYDNYYRFLASDVFTATPCTYYKHLCGEYHTSSAFAVWLSSKIIKEQALPDILRIDKRATGEMKNILIYNQYRNLNHSFILLQNA